MSAPRNGQPKEEAAPVAEQAPGEEHTAESAPEQAPPGETAREGTSEAAVQEEVPAE
jgi:hypothetical protein